MNFKYLLILVLLPFLTIQCEKDPVNNDPPDDPNDPETIETVSKNIGPEGSVIELDDVLVDIPAGAFEGTENITLEKIVPQNTGFGQVISDQFRLEGLPIPTLKPIKVSLKKTSTTTDSCYIALGQEAWNKSAGQLATGYNLIEARDSAGFVVGYIPAAEENANLVDEEMLETRGGDKWSLNLLAIVGEISIVSTKGHFKVVALSADLDAALNLAEYFETAYDKFLALNYSYSRRTRWPLTVTVKKLENEDGAQMNSYLGINYGYIEINENIMGNKAKMRTTAGHEFFHIVQSFYDPRGTFSMARSQSPNLWLEEASSTWSEELFSDNANYVPKNFQNNFLNGMNGLKYLMDDDDNADDYGYGMASFVKYLVLKYGDEALLNIYKNIKDGKDFERAITNAIPTTLSIVWDDYVEDLLSLKIYNGPDFASDRIKGMVAESFKPNSLTDTLKSFKHKYGDLSFRLYEIKKNHDLSFSENTILQFITPCESHDHLYFIEWDVDGVSIVAKGQDTINLDALQKRWDDGKSIAALVIHEKIDRPYEDEVEMESTLKILGKFTFDYFTMETLIHAYTEINKIDDFWGDTTYIFEGGIEGKFGIPSFISDTTHRQHQVHLVSGNTITTTCQFKDKYDWNRNYTIITAFDDILNPSEISRMEFVENYSYAIPEYTKSGYRKIVVTDISYTEFNIYDKSHNFILWENLGGHVETAEYNEIVEYENGNSTTRTLLDYDFIESYCKIRFKQY